MRFSASVTIGLIALSQFCGGGDARAQVAVGTPVDRNVADTSANAYSQRYTQPGLGQFGVGSLLLDRYGNDGYQTTRFDPFVADPRATLGHRYMLRAPGFHALMDRPDYIGPSPHGGWVRNAQTYDGAEILTLQGANTVYVLSPELLLQQAQPATTHTELPPNLVSPIDYTERYRVQPQSVNDPTPVDPRPYPTYRQDDPRNPNYVHPEIIERRKRLKEEREAQRQDEQDEAGHKEAQEEQKEDPQS